MRTNTHTQREIERRYTHMYMHMHMHMHATITCTCTRIRTWHTRARVHRWHPMSTRGKMCAIALVRDSSCSHVQLTMIGTHTCTYTHTHRTHSSHTLMRAHLRTRAVVARLQDEPRVALVAIANVHWSFFPERLNRMKLRATSKTLSRKNISKLIFFVPIGAMARSSTSRLSAKCVASEVCCW